MPVAQAAGSMHGDLLSRVLAQEVCETPWLDRTASRTALNSNGFPMPWKGRWQYSDFLTLVDGALDLSEAGDSLASCHDVEVTQLAHPENGAQRDELGSSEGVGDFPLIDINGLLFRSGTKLLATAKTARASISDASGSVDRHLVSITQNASLQVEEGFESGNRVVMCHLHEDASLDYEITMPQNEGIGYHCLVVWLAEGSSLNLHLASKGSQIRRNDVIVNVMGERANATLSGGWLVSGSDHLDTQVYMNHRVGNSHSEQSFHGVVDDRARSVFSGFIRIDRGASASEAHLTNRNIALSPQARAHAQPELEIYTDDVICSHGATTGQLDDDSLFLMRSRGVAEEAARAMLTKGFLRQVVHSEGGTSLLDL